MNLKHCSSFPIFAAYFIVTLFDIVNIFLIIIIIIIFLPSVRHLTLSNFIMSISFSDAPHLLKKSKGLPQQAEVAQGVPGRLRPRIFLTFRHYKGGRSSAKRTGRLYPRRNPWHSLSEAESTSGHMVLPGVPRKKSPVTPPGFDPGTVRLVATPGPSHISNIFLIQRVTYIAGKRRNDA